MAQPVIASHQRIRLLSMVLFGFMALFVVRLFYLQIVEHDKWTQAANSEQVKQQVLPAARGEIYALDYSSPVKIVLNEAVFTVFVDPEEVVDPKAIATAVREIAGGSAVKNIEDHAKAKPSRYQVVARNVTRKQADLLKEKNLKGLGFQPTSRRVYPEGKLAAQVLGFVNAEEKGQYGIEEALNTRLKGIDGMRKAVTDISNVPLTIGNNNVLEPPKNGENIVLTIDRNVQSFTESALAEGAKSIGATRASAIVMDPQNGHVMAMANLPTYDPEEFTKVQNAEAFNNATITTPYEPASVLKTFTMATALDKGAMTPQSTFVNTDYVQVEDRTITNAAKGHTGTISFQTALNWSLNTGTVEIAKRLGDGNSINRTARDTMYTYFHDRLGLGEKTGIQLAGETTGDVVSPSNPEGNAVRYSNMTFGQGLNVTMLQVAAGFSSLMNGGKYYKPTIVSGTVDGSGNYKPDAAAKPLRQTISASASQSIKKMVHDARASFNVTGDKAGYDIGGKTGTSQTLVNGKYDFNQTIGTYLGYGGDTKPRYVIMVQVSGDGKHFEGNVHAMPIFTQISNRMIDYLGLQPRG